MSADVKILANIGTVQGAAGKGIIYAARSSGGTYLAAVLHLEGAAENWKYYRRSRLEVGMSTQTIYLAGNFNLNLLTDQEYPPFVSDTDTTVFKTITSVTNGDDLPRLFNLESPYTVKGEGVLASEIEALKLGGSTSADFSLVTNTTTNNPAPTAKTFGIIPTSFDELFSNPLKFIQDNALFIGIVLAIVYYLRRKKKKPLWFF